MAFSLFKHHGKLERHSMLLLISILVVVAIGGLVEIVPLFYLESTIEKVDGMRPYTPLELEGRDIYIREGCYLCHSQMIRPLRDEVERYGHYSLAAESMYDHPFQWGSKRNGPDLARVGGKYSDAWHRDHLIDPRSLVPESIMPPYKFLATTNLDYRDIKDKLRAMRTVGVPYTDAQIAAAEDDLKAQADPSHSSSGLTSRYGAKLNICDFDGDPNRITEMDALIAYLQMEGTLVDFTTYKADAPANLR
jgi:cytochrome c oxidase cbb3-type subunit II